MWNIIFISISIKALYDQYERPKIYTEFENKTFEGF